MDMYKCGNCSRDIDKWNAIRLYRTQYLPGENYENSKLIVTLCPKCTDKLEESYYLKKED